ncbi:MAG: AMP-binding protein [Actinobacteria bacterium]|nr:AMP-binding protein [Actinomycetota bacterium]
MSADEIVLPYLLQTREREDPARPFLREVDGPPRSLGESGDAARLWAGALAALGVGRGDYVGSMMPTGIAAIELFFGINSLGAVEVPVHTEYRGTFLSHVLNTAGVKAVVIESRYLERLVDVAGDLPGLRTAIVVGSADLPAGLPFEVLGAADLLAAADPREPVDGLRPRDIASVLFTSGTTGASKGVLMPFAHLRASTEGAWPSALMTAEDTNYLVLPGYHISGKVAVDSMLLAGGQVAVRERFKTDEFWSDIDTTGATNACIMGAMAGFLMAAPERPDDAGHSLDKVLLLPLPDYLDEFRERFGVRVHTIYNQTEISCPIVSDGFTTGHYTSCGRLRDGYQVRIVDADDVEAPVGEVGELVVRADEPWTMMSGYIGMPEKTVESWRNQWLHTGDAFRRDADGNYYFVDRLKDVIRRRGENVSSVEVEIAVCTHEEVLECAAVPVASEWTEEEIMVCAVLKEGSALTEEELLAYLGPRMPRFMLPRFLEFVDELPKTPTQKIRKAGLRERGVGEKTWDSQAKSPGGV